MMGGLSVNTETQVFKTAPLYWVYLLQVKSVVFMVSSIHLVMDVVQSIKLKFRIQR